MNRPAIRMLVLTVLLAGWPVGGVQAQRKPARDPYAELFSFPPKIALDDSQKDKLDELKKEYRDKIAAAYQSKGFNSGDYLAQLIREVEIRKRALLTDAQKKALNIRVVIPDCVQEKALNDAKTWDLAQLEKLFVIQSRSYDPEAQIVALMVITRRKWTQQERTADAAAWNAGAVQAVFYNKDDEKVATLRSPMWTRGRNPIYIWPGITRTETRLTEKEAEQGLLRYRIKIDLAPGAGGKERFNDIKKAASVKVIYPEPKK